MRVCFFGTYSMEEGYPVNRMVLDGLRAAGIEVVECHVPLWDQPRERWLSRKWIFSPLFWIHTLKTYLKLTIKFIGISEYDLIMVGYLGHHDIFLARLLNLRRRKPIVLIAFNSLSETLVHDRRLMADRFPAAGFLRWLDRTSCRLSHLTILDTKAHIDYFAEAFRLPSSKFLRLFVGPAITPIGDPLKGLPLRGAHFNVLFVGTYIPLHGIDTILRAAKILEGEQGLQITLIGSGQLLGEMKTLVRTLGISQVRFREGWIPADELRTSLSSADICLGIFGTGEKARRVIPCKVYDALAMGRPVITADTPAARELLSHAENAILCPPGDPDALARAIMQLKKDPKLSEKIARNGRQTYLDHCTPEAAGAVLKSALERLTP